MPRVPEQHHEICVKLYVMGILADYAFAFAPIPVGSTTVPSTKMKDAPVRYLLHDIFIYDGPVRTPWPESNFIHPQARPRLSFGRLDELDIYEDASAAIKGVRLCRSSPGIMVEEGS